MASSSPDQFLDVESLPTADGSRPHTFPPQRVGPLGQRASSAGQCGAQALAWELNLGVQRRVVPHPASSRSHPKGWAHQRFPP